MPHHLIQLLGWLRCIYLLRRCRWPESSAEDRYSDIRCWKADIGGRTHRLCILVQILLPRLGTTELGASISSSSGVVGFPAARRVFMAERNIQSSHTVKFQIKYHLDIIQSLLSFYSPLNRLLEYNRNGGRGHTFARCSLSVARR
jgi:hypothetical protein